MLYYLNVHFNLENMKRFLDEFKCQRCNPSCCTGKTLKNNKAHLLPREVDRLAGLKGMTRNQFRKRYCVTQGGEIYLILPCPFYSEEKNSCTIWKDKPQVCIQFPFNQVYVKPEDGSKWMTCGDCPAGKVIGEKYGVKPEEVLV